MSPDSAPEGPHQSHTPPPPHQTTTIPPNHHCDALPENTNAYHHPCPVSTHLLLNLSQSLLKNSKTQTNSSSWGEGSCHKPRTALSKLSTTLWRKPLGRCLTTLWSPTWENHMGTSSKIFGDTSDGARCNVTFSFSFPQSLDPCTTIPLSFPLWLTLSHAQISWLIPFLHTGHLSPYDSLLQTHMQIPFSISTGYINSA